MKISLKYQVVIPQEIRQQMGITPGMEVSVLSKGGVIYIIPFKSLEDTSKALAAKFQSTDLMNYREKKDRKV